MTIKEKFLLDSIRRGGVTLEHVVNGRSQRIDIDNLVMVTARRPRDSLFLDLDGDPDDLESAGIKSVTRIGDCLAPSTIAAAVYEGHRYAREFDNNVDIDEVPYKREHISDLIAFRPDHRVPVRKSAIRGKGALPAVRIRLDFGPVENLFQFTGTPGVLTVNPYLWHGDRGFGTDDRFYPCQHFIQ